MSNSNQQKEAVLKLLQQCADDSIEDNNKSNTFNVILAGSLFHTLTNRMEVKQNIAAMENEDERLFMTLLVFMGLRPEEVYGMRWEDLQLENNCGFVHQVVTYPMKSHTCINTPKTKTSARTILITNTPKTILMASCKESGFVLGGEEPWCYSRTQRVRKRAFRCLGITGYSPYDFRTTFATQAKEG